MGAAQFDRARFFSRASFEGTSFAATAELSLTEFNDDADFSHCVFGACADFSYAKFNKNVDFSSVTFRDSVQFLAGFLKWNRTIRTFSVHSFVNFQEARFDKPAQVSFQSVFLRPNWFIGIDPREFTFSNVHWYPQKLSEEITQRELRKLPYFYQLLEKTCWDLSKNREEDSCYDEASKFRYWAFDLRRRSHFLGLAFWRLDWWYWAASGYGERTIRAFVTLLFIWFGFAGLYTRLDFAHSKPTTAIERQISESQQHVASTRLRFPDAIALSLQILLLESPDPAPVSFRGNMLARLEKLLGPVQAALFALAVRRKFMR
jgi:hypothetical protein